MKYLISFSLVLLSTFGFTQIVSLTPTSVGPDDAVVLTFDATQGNAELAGAAKVYLHHGTVTSSPDGTDWSNVVGNWGQDDGIGEMTPVSGEPDKWEIAFTPSIRDYFSVPAGENIFRISAVFRSADGSTKATIAPGDYGWGTVASNLDFFIDLNVGNFLSFNSPNGEVSYLESGESVTFSALASSEVSDMRLSIDDGGGYVELANVNSGTEISYQYAPFATGVVNVKVTATISGEDYEIIRQHNVVFVQAPVIESLPAGMIPGINYDENDNTKATLVLEAPGKEFAFVVGDFTNWYVLNDFQMKQTPDGELFWIEIANLVSQQEYVFQYWVEEDVKVGDPYADKVADPWNDVFIETSTYPNLPFYDKTQFGPATVLQTGQTEFQWSASENTWQRPDVNHLMIYELLPRDFIGAHNFAVLKDTLAYLKNLGIEAIEIMPFNEFEGNESWGYNPSYYFAPDKYYGSKDDLKRFIEAAHQEGMAVIMDVVMNHAFGQNPMVRMYFDYGAGKPESDNPWFNRDHVGQYEWGYDWNHESDYTIAFLDRLNKYWIEEYHVDGYRFDFTKGFTNNAPGGSVDNFDQSRIDIMKRMADVIWDTDTEAYIILEHWAPNAEEQILGDYGMKMWRNRSYDYVPAVIGTTTGSFNGMDAETHVSFFNSHDERRIAEHALSEGLSNGIYNIKDPLIMYERMKLAAAFAFLYPGPKMMWQFDELGYDIDINFNGRVGNKPLPWGPDGLGYYEDPLRQYIYDAYSGILDVRHQLGAAELAAAAKDHQTNGNTRRLSYDLPGTDLVVLGNFGLNTESIDPKFTQSGTWYDYFSGDSIDVTNVTASIELKAGQWHIYTTERLSDGLPKVVEIYDNPVTITPYPFTKSEEIVITFDATKAWRDGTAGLIGAEKVYFHSGVVLEHPDSSAFENVVGTLTDDGIGEMTEISDDLWQIILTPKDYYGLGEEEDVFKIGMYFRDAANVNLGKGFRDSDIYFNVESDKPFITIDPPAFSIDDEITITFNANRGNRGLVGANKVYLHSSVDLNNTSTPWNTGWQNVTGNWGMDDGVGQMSPVAGEPEMWEITLTPKDYYNLQDGDVAFWLAAVFRNADGSVKGTGTPGPLENGFIHTNQDFFIRNDILINTETPGTTSNRLMIYPNPANEYLNLVLENSTGSVQVELFDVTGKRVKSENFENPGHDVITHHIEIGDLPAGIFMIRVTGKDFSVAKELIKF